MRRIVRRLARSRKIWAPALLIAALPLPALLALAGCAPKQRAAEPAAAVQPARTSLEKLPVAPEELSSFAGSEACMECHSDLKEQLTTHHYHTMSKATDAAHQEVFGKSNSVRDAPRKLDYRTARGASGPELQARQGSAVEKVTPDWAFGSGNRCFTYVGLYDDAAVELRLSYYRQAGRWDFTPGQQPVNQVNTPVGQRLTRDDALACVNCHTTAAVAVDGFPQAEKSILGVGCEACHGAGKAHIEAVKLGRPDLKMLRLSEHRQRVTTELCGTCHRTEATGGDPHNATTQGQLPRLQGPAMMLSRCYKESNGRLGCVTCHNPHRNATDTPRAEYNRICGDCHRGPTHQETVCPKAPRGDCVSCHMPRQSVEMPTRPSFNTHWIKIWEKQGGRAAADRK
jgi:hypothetical protein